MPNKAPKKQIAIDEHKLSIQEVCQRYKVSVDLTKLAQSTGLSTEEAQKRLETDGPNLLSPPKQQSAILRFIECVVSIFNLLLIVASIFTFILYGIDPIQNSTNIYVGPILLGVTLLNAVIEFYQLQKSAAILKSFLNLIPSKCNVIRDGQLKMFAASELVKGDLIFLRMGDKTPADVFLVHCNDMKVDNSSLTGESEPQERLILNTHENPLEATNLAFNGTLVVSGEGYGIVIRTGDDTVIGQIAGMTQSEKKRTSLLTEEINHFVKIIGAIAVTSAIVFFIIASTTLSIGAAFNFAVGVLTAWVPQGLPATVTMLLTIAAKRMSKQNVLVKDLPCVETLGAITLLATDKTGTLTRNQMTVAYIWTEQKMFSVMNEGQLLKPDELAFDSNVKGVQSILQISAMCSRARFDKVDIPMDQRQIIGDATETGLFRLATQKLRDFDQLNDVYPKVLELPFNSDTKWHLTIHKMAHPNGVFTLFIKGAPERVLRICNTIVSNQGEILPLTEEDKVAFNTSYETMAGKGHRVLAFAKLELPSETYPDTFVFSKEDKNYPTSGLTFVGLASLEDPPKHGVREAIGNCRRAGIKVVMVTGDHPLTAEAIGRKINLMISDTKPTLAKKQNVSESTIQEEDVKAIVIHGESIDTLTEEDWDMIFAKEEIIFARTSPKHKLQIVKKAQSLGHIVGVTGDGVNDSPALKKADLGIAMNLSGSDVSKEAASMILLDDNFASIINGIKEGRLIFANLKKAIQYVVTHIIPEVVPQLLFVVANIPLGLNALQILVIDLGFELLTSLSFAYELPEGEALMKLMPRKPVDRESILYSREKRQFDLKFIVHDEESGEDKSRELTFKEKTKRFFCLEYWKKWMFTSPKGDVLVDSNVLMWAYVEAGVIEYIGSQVAFFVVLYSKYGMTPTAAVECEKKGGFTTTTLDELCPPYSSEELKSMLSVGQSIFYLSVMVIQLFNLFACKCLMTSPFRFYIFKNKKTWYAIAAGFIFAILIVYFPFLNTAFSTSFKLDVYYIFIPVAFGLFLYFYSIFRFYIKKKFRPITFTPEPIGLQMHPTRWSKN